jgi:7-cyano-7-deazaguanine synthase in queuosine biosynthesis
LDLLEIAAYVFSADRLTERGRKDQVEYQNWARRFQFRIRVRDHSFWSSAKVRKALRGVLCFMTGDAEYDFEFMPGHSTPPTSLFDEEGFETPKSKTPTSVALFSGGLDSLAGALAILRDPQTRAILVSHESQTGTIKTQRRLVDALTKRLGSGRVLQYRFECHLKDIRAPEETQRTRSFLYSSIGFAIARAHGQLSFAVFENGVTSMNLRRREDLSNARASRTTHPQTIGRLKQLFSLVAGADFEISTPFSSFTKADVIRTITEGGYADLISSTVSCSRTYQKLGLATHCGKCFQCVDRRIAIHAAEVERFDDPGLYHADIIASDIAEAEARTTALDYARQGFEFREDNIGHFETEYLTDLSAIVGYLPGVKNEVEGVEHVWKLMKRHGAEVVKALNRMRELHDDLAKPLPERSLLGMLADREHLKPEIARAVESIVRVVEQAVGPMFRRHPPKDERDLNEKLSALIKTHEPTLRSEHPSVGFACAGVVPDHTLAGRDLLIETKYVRKGTSPSKASDGIAADLIKYPPKAHILFFVYDPDSAIAGDEFRRDFEAKGRCTVRILK